MVFHNCIGRRKTELNALFLRSLLCSGLLENRLLRDELRSSFLCDAGYPSVNLLIDCARIGVTYVIFCSEVQIPSVEEAENDVF